MLRAALLAAVALALGLAGSARADAPEDARPVAEAFVAAAAAGDGAGICALVTAELRRRLGSTCRRLFGGPTAADQDRAARSLLREAFDAVRSAYPEGFPLPHTRLARELRLLRPGTRAALGRGPGAARGLFGDVVVIDTVRSSPRQLVLYVESDSGAVFRLVGGLSGQPLVTRALPGPRTPQPPPAPAPTLERLVPDGADVLAVVAFALLGQTHRQIVVLRLDAGAWRIADLFASVVDLFPEPL